MSKITKDKHRTLISASDCEEYRQQVKEYETVLEFAASKQESYTDILTHVNGECDHDVETPPRDQKNRSSIPREKCLEMRTRYRQDPNAEFEDLSNHFDCSTASVERHIKFQCTHSPAETIVTEVEEVKHILNESNKKEVDGPSIEEVVEEISNSGRKQTTDNLNAGTENPRRNQTTMNRIKRDKQIVGELKNIYGDTCQVCGDQRLGSGEPYSEGHHLWPLGEPHEGPDTPGNILILCPNHHVDFDHDHIYVDPETYEITHRYEDEWTGTHLTVADEHSIRRDCLEYQNDRYRD